MATGMDLSHALLNGSDEIAPDPCIFCHTRNNKHVESTHFCVDCDVKLCEACTEWHQSFPGMYTHQVEVAAMVDGTYGKNATSLPTITCEEHHNKLIDYFCQNHVELCCVFCVASKHRDCREVKYLPTLARGTKNGSAIRKVKKSTQILLQELKQARSSHHDILQCLCNEDTKSRNLLQGLKTRLVKRIDNMITAESDKIKTECQRKREAVHEDINAIDDQLNAIETSSKKWNEAQGDNETQLFVFMKQGEEIYRNGTKLVNTLDRVSRAHLHYKLNNTLVQDLCNTQRLGKFYMYTFGNDERALRLAYCANYNIKSAMDQQDCDIAGLCILSDASVVLADTSNNCLKQFDSFFRLTHTVAMSSSPNDICYISKTNEVAVSLYDKENIQFVSVGPIMAQTRSFQHFTIECRGICYSQDELFLLCSDIYVNRDIVCVFTLSGQILRTIPYGYLNCITVNPDGSKLHVADGNNVITMDRNGTLLWTYSVPDTTGICTLDDDSLLITSKFARSVLHVSSNGTKRELVLTKLGLEDTPQVVWYDDATNRVLLRTGSRNTLKVYIVE